MILLDVNERLLHKMFKDSIGIDIPLLYRRMTYKEAMDRFGVDKPDTRFGMELKDVSDIVKSCGFGVFTTALDKGGSVRSINAEAKGICQEEDDALVNYARTLEQRVLHILQLIRMGPISLHLQSS